MIHPFPNTNLPGAPLPSDDIPLPSDTTLPSDTSLPRDNQLPSDTPLTSDILLPRDSSLPNEIPKNVEEISRPLHITHDHPYPYGWFEMDKADFFVKEACWMKLKNKDDEIEKLKDEVSKLKAGCESQPVLNKKVRKSMSHKDLKTDAEVKGLTGIAPKAAFYFIFHQVTHNVKKLKYWNGPSKVSTKVRKFTKSPKKFGPERVISQKDEFLMTLMKLRLGSTNADLAQRFNISRTTVTNIIATWIKLLSTQLKCLIYNPPIEVVKSTLPKKFKKPGYSNVRHIIDCTEVFIDTPSDPALKLATWSDYKHHHTAKILVSITPSGAFNFVSKAWGGRTSDVQLTKESGFYDMLEPYDEVMVDRRFTIAEDLLLHKCHLHIPPGKCGREQFTKVQVRKTKSIANLRIYVEQAIGRLKTFRLIKHEVPISLVDKLDVILTICAALCNLYQIILNYIIYTIL